jgi:uncharacterized protein (TIGR03086 family)
VPPTQDPDLDALTSLSSHLMAALEAIVDRELTLPTPCSDWDLAALIDHVTGGNWFTGQVFGGRTAGEAMSNTMELFGGRGATTEEAASSVTEQLTTFAQAGVLDRTWHHVAGDLTGRQILRLRLHDLIVHTWDIKQTIDPPASVPADLARWGLAELSDQDSLTPSHFDLMVVPRVAGTEDAATSYLRRFGRSLAIRPRPI